MAKPAQPNLDDRRFSTRSEMYMIIRGGETNLYRRDGGWVIIKNTQAQYFREKC